MPVESSELVVTFLESVGRRQDAQFYLRLFRDLPKESFAVVVAEPEVFIQMSSLLEPLRFLSKLGLNVVIALGLRDINAPSPDFLRRCLEDSGLKTTYVSLTRGDSAARCATHLRAGQTVIVDLRRSSERSPAALLGALTSELKSRKMVILRAQGGLGPHREGAVTLTKNHQITTHANGISVINLTTDYDSLNAKTDMDSAEVQLLEQLRAIHKKHPSLLTSITSPLNLLRELFTIKGAGTLVKTGSQLRSVKSYDAVDQKRLRALIEDTFGRDLRPDFLKESPLNIYVESAYRGAAIVLPGRHGSFLSKFAVTPQARGEGIGRDLWEAILREHPSLYWRARASNPIAAWYATICEGMHRQDDWHIFWRGVRHTSIPDVIEATLSRPLDFITKTD